MDCNRYEIISKTTDDSVRNNSLLACYDILKFVAEHDYCRIIDITADLRIKYGNDAILVPGVKNLCHDCFENESKFLADNALKTLLLGIDYISNQYIKYLDYSLDELEKLIFEEFNKKEDASGLYDDVNMLTIDNLLNYYKNQIFSNYNDLMALSIAYYLKNNILSEDEVFWHIVDAKINTKDISDLAREMFDNSLYDSQHDSLDISNLCVDEITKNIFNILEIYTIGDYVNLIAQDPHSFIKISSCTIFNKQFFCNKFIKYSKNYSDLISAKIADTLNDESFKEKWIDVMYERYSVINNLEEKTLEETGHAFDLTRERIRQIEDKVIERLNAKKDIFIDIFEDIKTMSKNYDDFISYEEVYTILNDKMATNWLAVVFKLADAKISFDMDYKIFYYNDSISIDEIKKQAIDRLNSKIVTKDDYKKQLPYVKRIIETEYKASATYYVLKGISKNEIVYDLITELFPNGYHIDSDDYKKVIDKLDELYDDHSFVKSERGLIGGFERYDFVLCNKGTYVAKKYAPVLSYELVSNISDYILDQGDIVLYNNIFNHFKDELEAIGITNQYYLKGVLDKRLDIDVFFTSKSGIKFGSKDHSITSVINKYLEDNDKVVTINELKNDVIIGIEEYKIFMRLMNNNNVIPLSGKSYVHKKFVGITERIIIDMECIIDNLFKSNNTTVLSAGKIYANIKIMHHEILDSIHYIESPFDFYSLLYNLYKESGKYYFRRPYITTVKNEDLNTKSIIMNKISTLDRFNIDELNRYLDKIGVRRIGNVLSFINEIMENGFLTVNLKNFVREDIFKSEVGDENILKINKLIDQLVAINGTLNTSYFNLYGLFPQIKYKWNKYLLKGYITAFLGRKYTIEDTDTRYDYAEFIIRKVDR